MSCPLIIAQYSIRGHPKRTEHWVLAALLSRTNARVYEIAGNYDTFTYSSSVVSDFGKSPDYCGGCYLANVPGDKLEWVHKQLKDVEIIRYDSNFDSQVWVMSAIRHLKDEGVITEKDINERWVRDELSADKERWEVAEDTIEERLFPV
ncbi:hypothetical protein AMATHDRAFT_343 [Amanita thiersii Skay4041]|uniref:Uncharacterized protein n=1 Tax=Amanita thiersii Skay4041 TaxID=703135 RepID=A0A2A9P1R7_9AGAR|nr:hypothetical protein AMATHDRAFT_343 [Amanita thiersii Skay4041]